MPAAHLGRARCSLSLNATVPELPVICRDTWPSGCRFEYEPGIWLRMGTTDREVQSTVRRDYMGLLLSFGKNANIRTILDAGANVGLSTRLFASSHPDAQVVALEAQAGNYAMARLNTQRHQNVVVVHAALSDRDDQTMRIGAGPRRGYGAQYQYVARPIASDSLGGGAGAGAAAVGGMQAVGVTVGRLLEELCLPSFDFVKLDIEGSEARVLGASQLEWLANARYVYVEVHEDFATGARNASIGALRAAGMEVVNVGLRHEKVLLACSRRHFEPRHCMERCTRWAEHERKVDRTSVVCTAVVAP